MKRNAKWIPLVLLVGLLVLSACQPASQVIESTPPTESIQKMQDVPAIDQSQPDDFATATFSMG